MTSLETTTRASMQADGPADGPVMDLMVQGAAHPVPATLWRAADRSDRSPPLVLLQHGGPFHKRHERSDELASTLVERTGAAVLLVDGPIHGRRRPDAPSVERMLAEFEAHWRSDPGIDGMVDDWRAALDAVLDAGWADRNRIVWLGVSMGTAYGIPLCAREPRISAAALGMWGTDWGQQVRLLADARRMRTPTLFQIKDADEIFSTEGQRDLFDAIGSPDKCLHTFAGGHSLAVPGQLDQILEFLAPVLAGGDPRGSGR